MLLSYLLSTSKRDHCNSCFSKELKYKPSSEHMVIPRAVSGASFLKFKSLAESWSKTIRTLGILFHLFIQFPLKDMRKILYMKKK